MPKLKLAPTYEEGNERRGETNEGEKRTRGRNERGGEANEGEKRTRNGGRKRQVYVVYVVVYVGPSFSSGKTTGVRRPEL
jgi:hypothetical protein